MDKQLVNPITSKKHPHQHDFLFFSQLFPFLTNNFPLLTERNYFPILVIQLGFFSQVNLLFTFSPCLVETLTNGGRIQLLVNRCKNFSVHLASHSFDLSDFLKDHIWVFKHQFYSLDACVARLAGLPYYFYLLGLFLKLNLDLYFTILA